MSVRSILGLSLMVVALGTCVCAFAVEAENEPSAKPLLWVVETTDEDARMSLDRVSGTSESPYVSGDNTYRSENHYFASPFALSKLNENRE
ncbi:MAG: hypothetical protein MOGMAGMI_01247 [Candidatus Omnitrophica bacterium]|nr:hypothetical protein [Candidatus Omnitrophota bacterium]